MCCDNRKVRLRQTVNAGANCRFREIFVEQFNSIARFKISHCTPLSLSSSIARTRDVKLPSHKKCNTQSFPVVCDSPSPGTSWRNRENPAPLRAHVLATIGKETVAILPKLGGCSFARFLNAVEELKHQRSNPTHFFFQREMARVEKMELCTGNIPFNKFSTIHRKDSVVFAPSDQRGGLLFAEILLPIGKDIQIPF